jgi:hypothetical protein
MSASLAANASWVQFKIRKWRQYECVLAETSLCPDPPYRSITLHSLHSRDLVSSDLFPLLTRKICRKWQRIQKVPEMTEKRSAIFKCCPENYLNKCQNYGNYYVVSVENIRKVTDYIADHSGRAVWVMNCLRPLEHWDRVFESHSRHGCLCAFILCLCCSVCR